MTNRTYGGPDDRLAVTVPQFSAAVGMSATSVYANIKRGNIPAHQFGPGGSFRIPRSFMDRITGAASDGR